LDRESSKAIRGSGGIRIAWGHSGLFWNGELAFALTLYKRFLLSLGLALLHFVVQRLSLLIDAVMILFVFSIIAFDIKDLESFENNIYSLLCP